jgi:hypothetical protein
MSLFGNTQEQKLPRETDKTVNTEIVYEIINLNKMNEKIDQMEKKYLFMKMNLEFLFVIMLRISQYSTMKKTTKVI